MIALAGALCGLLAGLGVLVIVVGLRAEATQDPGRVHRRWRDTLPEAWANRIGLRAGLAGIALVVVGYATHWPVAAMLAAIGAALAPSLIGAKARRSQSVARLEAIAVWTEQLRDVMAAAGGIQEAIVATAPLAPRPIAAEVGNLARSLNAGRRLGPTLERLAQDLAHPLSDMVVTSLLLAQERQGHLRELLTEVASSARAEATIRMEIEAARARTYVTVRLIVGVTIGMGIWLVIAQRDYVAAFDSPSGQIVLLVIGAIFATAGLQLHRMAQPSTPQRLLAPVPRPAQEIEP